MPTKMYVFVSSTFKDTVSKMWQACTAFKPTQTAFQNSQQVHQQDSHSSTGTALKSLQARRRTWCHWASVCARDARLYARKCMRSSAQRAAVRRRAASAPTAAPTLVSAIGGAAAVARAASPSCSTTAVRSPCTSPRRRRTT
jgi:hypothetical protein